MKRKRLIAACIIVLFAGGFAVGFALPGRPVELSIYAYDGCGGCFADGAPCMPCSVMDELNLTFFEILEEKGLSGDGVIRLHNTKYPEERQAMEKVCAELGISADTLDMPFVIINGKTWHAGANAAGSVADELKYRNPLLSLMHRAKRHRILDNNEIAYFYSELCGDCVRADKYISRYTAALESKGVTLVKYNIDEAGGYSLLAEFMSGYGISHKNVSVPYLFWGGEYYHGSDAIGAALALWYERGR